MEFFFNVFISLKYLEGDFSTRVYVKKAFSFKTKKRL
jgi:hypothetical protein